MSLEKCDSSCINIFKLNLGLEKKGQISINYHYTSCKNVLKLNLHFSQNVKLSNGHVSLNVWSTFTPKTPYICYSVESGSTLNEQSILCMYECISKWNNVWAFNYFTASTVLRTCSHLFTSPNFLNNIIRVFQTARVRMRHWVCVSVGLKLFG